MLSFALKLHKGSIIAESLSNMGVYVSTKSACSSREEGYSYVLRNAGYDEVIASNGIRLSFSGTEDMKDAVDFISAFVFGQDQGELGHEYRYDHHFLR